MIVDIQNQIEPQKKSKSHFRQFWLYYLFILIEAVLIILYAQFTKFGEFTNPKNIKEEDALTQLNITKFYSFFQDVHVMIFVGFGFLMTFLKRYSYSAVGLNFFASCVVIIEFLLIGGAVQQVCEVALPNYDDHHTM